MNDNHVVHMADGTKQVLSGEELNALDPKSWTAAEPAERERHIVIPVLVGDEVRFKSIDRETGEELDHETRAQASAVVQVKQLAEPVLSIAAAVQEVTQ